MNRLTDVIIIGGGLAGLTAAIHLLQNGKSVLLIEKNEFPKHKVCGEFISNEVLSYFKSLKLDIESLSPTKITRTQLSTTSGKSIETKLPLGGFGISRYTLDYYLYQKVMSLKAIIVQSQVDNVNFEDDIFTVKTNEYQIFTSKIVLGAFGKRSNLDKQLNRDFIQQKSPWLAVKAHYQYDFPNDLVGLHNFIGGYCGVSKVENNAVNICYLVQYRVFKKYKNIEDFETNVMHKNPHLQKIVKKAKPLFEKPLTISQISFENKPKVEHHILMMGDAAGLIHPLCGNGMAMAIHSAKLASESSISFLDNKVNRVQFEKQYILNWNANFKNRLHFGKILSKIILNSYLSNIVMQTLFIFPFLLPKIIKKTHGNPI